MLPSYRERVVQIRLSDEEGGLNLSMDNDTIKRVVDKGDIAGQKILDHFKFDHHQWVRFQVLMGLLEAELTKMETVLREEKLDCKKLVKNQHDPNQKYPYRRPQQPWCDEALARIEKMQYIVENWSKSSLLDEKTPRPEAVLRVTPEL